MTDDFNRNFVGKFNCSLDVKSRLKIPAALRSSIPPELFKKLIIIRGKEKYLKLYTVDEYDKVITGLRDRAPGPERDYLVRFYSDRSHVLNVDAADRVAIPADCLETIDNAKSVVVVGALSCMEIWNAADYEKVRSRAEETYLKSDFAL